MSTTATTTLADQLRCLLDEAGPTTVPGRVLAWWGNTALPDGSEPAPALTRLQWDATYRLLENAALDDDAVRPLAMVQAACNRRPDGPVPIALASFRVAVPRSDVAESVRAAAASGEPLDPPPASLAEAIEERRVFAASALLQDQWGLVMPTHRGRDVTFSLEGAFYLTNPAGAWPDKLELDLGDGEGWRPAAFGDQLQAHYDGDVAEIALRGHYGGDALVARFTLPISDGPGPPAPDDTWELQSPATAGRQAASGRAWVFRAPRRTEIVNPVIIVEGFPGGHPCSYLYDLLNQQGTVQALHANGYDLVIVGLDNGLIPIQDNAGVLVQCIREARRRTRQPLVVGGVSMGGIISRYALARMETMGEPHSTLTYLSIDAPHRGTYTTLGVQWFVHALLPYARSLRGFAMLLDSPSNQQLMIAWFHDGKILQSGLRDALVEDLEAVGGYPRQPRKLAVSCGNGEGIGGPAAAGEQTLAWAQEPFVSITLGTLPRDGDAVIADGSWLLAQPPALVPLRFPNAPPWETAPGSQNTYNADAAGIAEGWGCGQVRAAQPMTCCVPTVSALDIEQDAFDPVASKGPFDDHVCSKDNVLHLEITQEVSDWIVAKLGPAPAPVATPDRRWPPPMAGGAAAAQASGPAWNPADFDPHDHAFLDDPYPTYACFQANGRDFFVSQYASRWFFRYDDCATILNDSDTYLKNPPEGLAPPPQYVPPPNPIDLLDEFPTGMFMADGEAHDEIRAAFQGPFYDQVRGARPLADGWAKKVLDRLRPSGHMELMSDFALPVPANVLFDVLGIPEPQTLRGGLLQWEMVIVPSHDITQNPQVRFRGGTTRMALVTFLEGLVHKYHAGGPGLIGALAPDGASPLTRAEVSTSCVDFVVAGYLSTTWLVGCAMNLLLSDPPQWPALRQAILADPAQADAAIEEVLRLEPPFQLADRYLAKDATLAGCALKKGDLVTAVIGSANRDPDKYVKPDELVVGRDMTDAPLLSFGQGRHDCIGAPLARIMAPAMLRQLATLDDLQLDGEPQWGSDPFMREMTSLPLRFRPAVT